MFSTLEIPEGLSSIHSQGSPLVSDFIVLRSDLGLGHWKAPDHSAVQTGVGTAALGAEHWPLWVSVSDQSDQLGAEQEGVSDNTVTGCRAHCPQSQSRTTESKDHRERGRPRRRNGKRPLERDV